MPLGRAVQKFLRSLEKDSELKHPYEGGLQRLYIRTVTIGAFRGCLFIDDEWLITDDAPWFVTLITRHVGVASRQWEMSLGVVIEGRGHPALRIVAVGTRCLPGLRELAVMSVLVTIFANL
jgi:hypothetical protein